MPNPGPDFSATPAGKLPRASEGAARVLRAKTKIAKSAARTKSKGAATKRATKINQPETEPAAGCSAWWNF
jgi:hypothetical protein